MTRPLVGFAGMTHLGLNSAAASAARGFQTVGFDPDPALIRMLRAGRMSVSEPDLDRCVAESAERLTFTSDTGKLGSCDVVYVAADVPTDDGGASDLSGIRSLIGTVRPALSSTAILVILSQVPPGFTRGLGLPAATTYYQVESLIFGRAIERAMYPERYIVGCAEPHQALPAVYAAVLQAYGCPVLTMLYESAELAKIAINCCLAASISVANSMAEISERIGADWSEIAPALRLDKRIGEFAYLAPGLGLAGGNLERDLATACRLADENGTDPDVIRAFISNSAHRKAWPFRVFHDHVVPAAEQPVVAVLGLTYKENTDSTKNSPAVALIQALRGVAVRTFDPVAKLDPAWSGTAVQLDDPLEACASADAVFIMNRWPVFAALDPRAIASQLSGHVVVDPYGVLDAQSCARAGLRRITLGAAER